MTASKAFGDEHVAKPHLIKPQGGVAAEIWDLRIDIERAFSRAEGRPAADQYPEVTFVDGGLPALTGGDLVLRGTRLIQGQTFASLAVGTGTSKLTITALKPGVGGNDFTIAIVHAGGAPAVVVAKVTNAITITANLGVHTADQVATAINANGADTDGYLRCLSGGGGTTIAALAATHLAGGVGEGWTCTLCGAECLPANTAGTSGAAALTETLCTVTVPDLTALVPARTVADELTLTVTSDGVLAQTMVIGFSAAMGLTLLSSTTGGSEGALLVGTDSKTNLGASTTVEACLTNIDGKNPPKRSSGAVTPLGAVAGAVGDLYVDTVTDIAYVNIDGTNTGWVVTGSAALTYDYGVVPVVTLVQAGQPVAAETLVIGGDTYTARAPGALGPFEFEISAVNAETTMDNLLAKIVANGTALIVADKISATELRLRAAATANGVPLASNPNIAVTENLTNYLSNAAAHGAAGNFNTMGGRAAGLRRHVSAQLTVTTAMIAVGAVRIAFPAAVVAIVSAEAFTAAGEYKALGADHFTIANNDVLLNFHGGGGDLANTNVVRLIVAM
jgi:hypothetical protein